MEDMSEIAKGAVFAQFVGFIREVYSSAQNSYGYGKIFKFLTMIAKRIILIRPFI